MRVLPEADRYYLFAFSNNKKTHLLYFTGFDYHIACFPNMPIEMVSFCEGSKDGISSEEADFIDSYFNELTCPTCLRMAQGNRLSQSIMRLE